MKADLKQVNQKQVAALASMVFSAVYSTTSNSSHAARATDAFVAAVEDEKKAQQEAFERGHRMIGKGKKK